MERPLRWFQYRLSTLFWIAIGVALLVTVIVQTVRLQRLDEQKWAAERQVEDLRRLLPKEIQPGQLAQVSEGPGYLFRGSLPQGVWRLAVYSWQGGPNLGPEVLFRRKAAPPAGLAPLMAKKLPNPDNVEIRISKVTLPPGVTCEGKDVRSAFNIKILNDRQPVQSLVPFTPLQPLLLSDDLGSVAIAVGIAEAPLDPKEAAVLLYIDSRWDIDRRRDTGNRYLILVEPLTPGRLKPQIGTEDLD